MAKSAATDKKELIREAALRAFAQHGFHHTTANAIAMEAGVAVGTLYNYFKSKDDILIHIFEVEKAERLQMAQEIMQSDLPMREKFFRLMNAHITRGLEQREIMRLLLSEELHLGGQVETCTHQIFKEVPNHIAEILERAMARGEIRQLDPLVAANIVFGAARAVLVRLCLYDDEQAYRMKETAAEELAEFLWRGLKPDETDKETS